ncbi:MAG: hypothetical protein AB7I79_21595 [Rhizobiaceae bacterium]
MVSGGIISVLGMFVVTIVFDVSLSNALAAVDRARAHAADLWMQFLCNWTF